MDGQRNTGPGNKKAQEEPRDAQGRPLEEMAQAIGERFKQAREGWSYWQGEYERSRATEDQIAAAQEWDIMAGLAAAAQAAGIADLMAELEKLEPKPTPSERKRET